MQEHEGTIRQGGRYAGVEGYPLKISARIPGHILKDYEFLCIEVLGYHNSCPPTHL